MEAPLELGLSQGARLKECFHQGVVGFRHHFDERVTGRVHSIVHGGWWISHCWRAALVRRECHRLHRHQVDTPGEIGFFTNRELDRYDLATAAFVQRFQRSFETRSFSVEAIETDQAG